jgi:hypothetical protein
MTKQSLPRRGSIPAVLFNLLLTLSLVVPILMGVAMAVHTIGTPWEPFRHRIWIVVVICALNWFLAIALSMRRFRSAGTIAGDVLRISVSLLTLLCPVIARVVIPWEEPGTGMGSPLAVLVGLLFAAIPVAAFPGLAFFANSWMSSGRMNRAEHPA